MHINDRIRLNLILSVLAFVISAAGSVLLQIVFATSIYKQTGSGVLTSLFISLQWLPILAVLIYKSDWEDGADPRRLWLKMELVAAALTCPILWFVDQPNYYALFALLFLRGTADHVARIVKTVSARYIFPVNKATQYAPIMQAGLHVGICVAAVVGIGLGQHFTLRTATLIDIASFLLAAALVACVRTVNDERPPVKPARPALRIRAANYLTALASDPRLMFSALLPPLTAALFQGSYSVFQPLFPIRVLHLDANAVSIAYVLASLAILAGSTLFAYLNKRSRFYLDDYLRTKHIIFALSAVSALSYLLCVLSNNVVLSAVGFTLMVFTFEMVWMFGYAGIVAYAPQGELGSVYGITFGIGCCGASLCAMLAGFLLDHMNGNFGLVVASAMSLYALVLVLGQLRYQQLDSTGAGLPASK